MSRNSCIATAKSCRHRRRAATEGLPRAVAFRSARRGPDHHVLRCLNTNGYLVTEELSHRLVGLADEVRVSLDGMRLRNDAIRGQGSFDAAVRALKCLYAVGFEPVVMVTITSVALPDLEELLWFLDGMNITRIHLNRFRPIGRALEHGKWQVPKDQVDAVTRKVLKRKFQDPLPGPVRPESSETSNCGVGSFVNILPNGDVYPCHVLMSREFHCGSIRKKSLMEICNYNGLLSKLALLDFTELNEKYGCR